MFNFIFSLFLFQCLDVIDRATRDTQTVEAALGPPGLTL